MLSYCGINCIECLAYIVTKENNDKRRKEVAKIWREKYNHPEIKADDINCHGCLTDDDILFNHCKVCEIRKCGIEEKVENCAFCEKYICEKLDGFLKQHPEEKERLNEIWQQNKEQI